MGDPLELLGKTRHAAHIESLAIETKTWRQHILTIHRFLCLCTTGCISITEGRNCNPANLDRNPQAITSTCWTIGKTLATSVAA